MPLGKGASGMARCSTRSTPLQTLGRPCPSSAQKLSPAFWKDLLFQTERNFLWCSEAWSALCILSEAPCPPAGNSELNHSWWLQIRGSTLMYCGSYEALKTCLEDWMEGSVLLEVLRGATSSSSSMGARTLKMKQ